MKDELAASMRIAMDRGQKLEDVVKSLISAGYNPQEVRAAEEMINGGVIKLIYKDVAPDEEKGKEKPVKKEIAPSSLEIQGAMKGTSGKKSQRALIAVIIIVIVILMGILGYLIYSFLKGA